MPFLSAHGVKLNYIRTGAGADVVLAHGLASSLAFWYPRTALLLRQCYQVTAYDLRGHGYSSMPAAGYTHMGMADDLARLVDSLGLKKFHLVGHSFGGLVSLSYARRYPHRLRSLVLADVPLNEINDEVPEWPYWWPSLMKFQQLGLVIPPDEPYPELRVLEELARPQVRQRIGNLLPQSTRRPYGWGKGTERTAKRWLKLLNTTSARQDIRSRCVSVAALGQIGIRTLAVYGTESKWCSSGEVLGSYLPNVEVAYIDKAGHAHPWERPQEFFQLLQPFLAESDRLAPATRDQRRFARFPWEMPVSLRFSGGNGCPARTVNVSRQGLLLDYPEALGPGSEIEIVATLHQNGEDLIIPGKIVREWRDEADEGFRLGVDLLWPGRGPKAWEEFVAALAMETL
jgi:pimeloyl-ACP methyl ester carboxylesterase